MTHNLNSFKGLVSGLYRDIWGIIEGSIIRFIRGILGVWSIAHVRGMCWV